MDDDNLLNRMCDNNYSVEERVELLLDAADKLQNDSGKALTPNGYLLAFEALYRSVEEMAQTDNLIQLEEMTDYLKSCQGTNAGHGYAQVTSAGVRKKWNTIVDLVSWSDFSRYFPDDFLHDEPKPF